jgi:hypothetical protein
MTSWPRSLLVAALALAPLAACDDHPPEFWSTGNSLLPAVALDDKVAIVERNGHTAYVLDPADANLTPVAIPVGKSPVLAVKRNGSNQLLVLGRGQPGSAVTVAVPAELDLIDASTSAMAASFTLAGRFDGLAQSSDGRFVILYHTSSKDDAGDTALYNPNELVLIDLAPPASPTVPKQTQRSIRSLGGVPTGVDFLPFADGSHHLALIEAQNYVTILDLDLPERSEISIPLCPEGKTCNFNPSKILLASSDFASTGIASIFVQATSSKDIFQIALTGADLHASLSMLTVGASPSDMALYGSGVDTRLAVLAPDLRSLVIIDPSTSRTVSVSMSIPANVIVPFLLPSPTSAGVAKPQALLVDRGRGSTSLLFANLDTIETTGSLSLTDYALDSAASNVRPIPEQGTVVIELSGFGKASNTAFSVIDLATRSSSSIGAGADISQFTYETGGPARLWTVSASFGLSYLNLVARPSAARLATGETWLDQAITRIIPLAKPASDGKRYLVALHNDPDRIGNLTVLDAEQPDRAGARTGYGFLFTSYLEREQP